MPRGEERRYVTGELIVLDAPVCWATEAEIFEAHSIPRRCSFDPDAVDDEPHAVLPAPAPAPAPAGAKNSR